MNASSPRLRPSFVLLFLALILGGCSDDEPSPELDPTVTGGGSSSGSFSVELVAADIAFDDSTGSARAIPAENGNPLVEPVDLIEFRFTELDDEGGVTRSCLLAMRYDDGYATGERAFDGVVQFHVPEGDDAIQCDLREGLMNLTEAGPTYSGSFEFLASECDIAGTAESLPAPVEETTVRGTFSGLTP